MVLEPYGFNSTDMSREFLKKVLGNMNGILGLRETSLKIVAVLTC